MAKIGIFIPCYNVEKSIKDVLTSLSDEVLNSIAEIVTVDNCSKDNTLGILKEIKGTNSLLAKRLVIIKNSQNYGLGGSQKIAYQYFLDNNFTHFMIIHGDGQGDSEQIARNFLEVFQKTPEVDFIIASRFTKSSDTSEYNTARVLGNYFFNFLTFILTGHKMTDSGAAILFYRTEILRHVEFAHLTNSFQFNPQLNILLYNLKTLKIVEVPLKWKDSKDKSNISSINYCITLLKILLRYRINKTILKKTSWQAFHNESQKFQANYEILK